MKYFILYNQCYISWGYCKAGIYDVLQKRVFWVEKPEHQIFLKYSHEGMSVEDICHRFDWKEEEIFKYVDFLRQLDLGTLYDHPKTSTKFRPFIHSHLEEKNGYYRQLSIVTMEISSECKEKCRFCDLEKRISTLECVCGCYSDTRGIDYPIADTIRSLSHAKPGMLELMGGDPFCNKKDLYEVVTSAYKYHIPVKIKTSGILLEKEDFQLLKRYQVYLSFILPGFIPDEDSEEYRRLIKILGWAAEYDYTAIDIILLMEEQQLENKNKIQQWLSTYYLNVSIISCNYPLEILSMDSTAQLQHLRPFLMSHPYQYAINVDGLARHVNGHPCWQDRLCIMQNGDVRPCIAATDINYGNLKEKNILDIIREERPTEIIKQKNSNCDSCSQCEFNLGCSPCAVTTRKIHGSYSDKAWNCIYEPISGEFKTI